MTTPPCRPSPLVLVLISILAWIGVIGAILYYLFGAEAAEIWFIASAFFSMAGMCFVVLLKELHETFVVPAMWTMGNRYESFHKADSSKQSDAGVVGDGHLADRSLSGPRREALGLGERRDSLNRHRKAGERSTATPICVTGYAFEG